MTTREIAQTIADYALDHYTEGYDVIVECWTLEMIEEKVIEEGGTLDSAREYFASLADIWLDRILDARNSAF